MKKAMLCGLILILVTTFVLSSDSLGIFKQGDCVSLYQLCDNCTYVNLTSVTYPNSTVEVFNEEMTKDGVDYTSNFCNTLFLGDYSYKVCGDKNGGFECELISFKVTPTGEIQNPIWNNAIAIFLGILAVILIIAAVKLEAPWMGFISAIMFLLLGIYLMIYGFNDVTNTYTRGTALAIIGIGIILMGFSAYEWWLHGSQEE